MDEAQLPLTHLPEKQLPSQDADAADAWSARCSVTNRPIPREHVGRASRRRAPLPDDPVQKEVSFRSCSHFTKFLCGVRTVVCLEDERSEGGERAVGNVARVQRGRPHLEVDVRRTTWRRATGNLWDLFWGPSPPSPLSGPAASRSPRHLLRSHPQHQAARRLTRFSHFLHRSSGNREEEEEEDQRRGEERRYVHGKLEISVHDTRPSSRAPTARTGPAPPLRSCRVWSLPPRVTVRRNAGSCLLCSPRRLTDLFQP
ncbi:hypothetical protein F2P81_020688 [Scophthalmus maximus]|uniref:Uncharacterized protein n=1 Tax=Scophthalmus maximus TaxID=52904 RepID=A0A6A4S4H6_SCOMX|nr:hypothetical protein F2P81_020688 [Scophthalmus maximus]